jgi:hypothetical protein
MCVDYRGLNQLAIKNEYPLLLILGLLHQLSHAKVYTQIDLHGTYNLMHIREGDEWKMAFKTHSSHLEYVLMSFGLTNVPTIFQHLMNNVFCEYLDNFVVCYINDIFIFSKNVEDNEHHVHLLLEKLQEFRLYAKLKMCEFHQFEIELLGYVIFGDDICMDSHKVQTILDWAT